MTFFDIIYLLLFISLAPIWIPFIALNKKARYLFRHKLFPRFTSAESYRTKTIWIHGASVGEVDIAIRLINRLDSQLGYSFVLTTNTVTGLEIAKKNFSGISMLAPFDFSFLIRQFIRKFSIHGLILIETEIWPNMIQLVSAHSPVVIVNGRLSDKHFGKYNKYRNLFAGTLEKLSKVFAGDKISAERFVQLGVPSDNIEQPGNIKFNLQKSFNTELLNEIKKSYEIQESDFIWVNGSIQPEEMGHLTEAWFYLNKKIPNLRMILIPRHPEKLPLFEEILNREFIPFEVSTETKRPNNQTGVHLIARMGVLKTWYKLADSIFVGGSFSQRGGQNMLEAVALEKAVSVGPYAVNFKQEVDLLKADEGLAVVKNTEELIQFTERCYTDQNFAKQMGKKGKAVIEDNSSAIDTTTEQLKSIFMR